MGHIWEPVVTLWLPRDQRELWAQPGGAGNMAPRTESLSPSWAGLAVKAAIQGGWRVLWLEDNCSPCRGRKGTDGTLQWNVDRAGLGTQSGACHPAMGITKLALSFGGSYLP